MITLADYQMPRFPQYAHEWTPEIEENALQLIDRVNLLLADALEDGVEPAIDQVTGTRVSSGWRPKSVNDRTANAAKSSTHLDGRGIDLQDWPSRRLARWILRYRARLSELGLYMEDPRWTGGPDPWVHLDTKPRSVVVYIPSSAPPRSAPLPEQTEVA